MLETFQCKQLFPINESNGFQNKHFYDATVTIYVKFVRTKYFHCGKNSDLFGFISFINFILF